MKMLCVSSEHLVGFRIRFLISPDISVGTILKKQNQPVRIFGINFLASLTVLSIKKCCDYVFVIWKNICKRSFLRFFFYVWIDNVFGLTEFVSHKYFEFFTDDTRWMTVTKTGNGRLEEFTVSYQNLLPSTAYNFRVIAYNKFGISFPASSNDIVSIILFFHLLFILNFI